MQVTNVTGRKALLSLRNLSIFCDLYLHKLLQKKAEMWFKKYLPRLPVVKADDEELVDPQQTLRESCNETDHCKHLREKYEACNDRVNSKSRTTEICNEELFDWLHAVDHCVTKDLFSKLK